MRRRCRVEADTVVLDRDEESGLLTRFGIHRDLVGMTMFGGIGQRFGNGTTDGVDLTALTGGEVGSTDHVDSQAVTAFGPKGDRS